VSPETTKRVLVYRAHSHASLYSHGFSFVGMRVAENRCTLSSNAVQVPTRVRKDFKKDTDG
jgi:hypothetical protein